MDDTTETLHDKFGRMIAVISGENEALKQRLKARRLTIGHGILGTNKTAFPPRRRSL